MYKASLVHVVCVALRTPHRAMSWPRRSRCRVFVVTHTTPSSRFGRDTKLDCSVEIPTWDPLLTAAEQLTAVLT